MLSSSDQNKIIQKFTPYFINGIVEEYQIKTQSKENPTFNQFIKTFNDNETNKMLIESARAFIEDIRNDKGNNLSPIEHIEKHEDEYQLITSIVQRVFNVWSEVGTLEKLVTVVEN